MQNCVGSSKLCEKVQKTTGMVVRICVVNGLKCEYVQKTAERAALKHCLCLVLTSFKAVMIFKFLLRIYLYCQGSD